MYDVTIIGCGIVGAAAAYEFSKYDLSVLVLEKENDVGVAATKANSAIIHVGYDPPAGTLMAKLNVEGASLAKDICMSLDVPYKQIGALVLAFSNEELSVLQALLRNGQENGVSDLSILERHQVLELEPNLSDKVVAALYAPGTAIVIPWEYALAMAETAVKNGAELMRECNIEKILKHEDCYIIPTLRGLIETRYIINAAGLSSDKIPEMIDSNSSTFTITPSRGEYYLLDKSEGDLVRHVIYQCPTAQGKGVIVTPTVHGNLIVGPNAADTNDVGDVSTTSAGMDAVRNAARKSVPGINFRANIRNFAGSRAKTDQNDFIINHKNRFINLAGIASPGLSAAPAIAKMAVQFVRDDGLDLREKTNFINERKIVRFNKLSHSEKADLVNKNDLYGRVICRCETVTEGEIMAALHSPIPPKSIDAVKRRVGAGFGRCQGGFCAPRVVEILSKFYGIAPKSICQDGIYTQFLVSETKNTAQKTGLL